MAEDGGAVKLRARRDDGTAFTAGRFNASPMLARRYPDLPVARVSRFRLNMTASSQGSTFTLTAEEGGRLHPLGRIIALP